MPGQRSVHTTHPTFVYMNHETTPGRSTLPLVAAAGLLALLFVPHSLAQSLIPGDLLVSRSTYDGIASTVTVGQALPGGGTAVADGSSLNVFNNETPDPSFGITSSILLDQYNTSS